MLASMPSWMLDEWIDFDRAEPIDLRYRVDLNAGIVAAMLANVFGSRRKTYRPEAFMPKFKRPVKKRKAEDLYQEFRAWAQFLGADHPKDKVQ